LQLQAAQAGEAALGSFYYDVQRGGPAEAGRGLYMLRNWAEHGDRKEQDRLDEFLKRAEGGQECKSSKRPKIRNITGIISRRPRFLSHPSFFRGEGGSVTSAVQLSRRKENKHYWAKGKRRLKVRSRAGMNFSRKTS